MKYVLTATILVIAIAILLGTALDASAPQTQAAAGAGNVDYDFTRMSHTMRQTIAYRLMAAPADLSGKTMSVPGKFLTAVDEKDGKRHFGCLLGTPGGCPCCTPSGVLEFIPEKGMKWPDDFPPEETQVIVTGKVKLFIVTDEEKGGRFTIPRLVDATVSR